MSGHKAIPLSFLTGVMAFFSKRDEWQENKFRFHSPSFFCPLISDFCFPLGKP